METTGKIHVPQIKVTENSFFHWSRTT